MAGFRWIVGNLILVCGEIAFGSEPRLYPLAFTRQGVATSLISSRQTLVRNAKDTLCAKAAKNDESLPSSEAPSGSGEDASLCEFQHQEVAEDSQSARGIWFAARARSADINVAAVSLHTRWH